MIAADGKPTGVRQMGVQEVDIVSVVRPLPKYAVTIDQPESIRYHLEKAVYLARSGRPGPVWIDIPLDVQASPIDPATLQGFIAPSPDKSGTGVLAGVVARVIDALNRSERPLLLAGNGIRLARAEQEFRDVLELLDIPVETTWLAIDLIAEDDARFVGRPGNIAPRGANFAIQNCDFLLSIGARLDRVVTGYARSASLEPPTKSWWTSIPLSWPRWLARSTSRFAPMRENFFANCSWRTVRQDRRKRAARIGRHAARLESSLPISA